MAVHTNFRHLPFSRTIQWPYAPKGTFEEWVIPGIKVILMGLYLCGPQIKCLSRVDGGSGIHKLKNIENPLEGIIYSRHGYFNKIQGDFQGLFKKKTHCFGYERLSKSCENHVNYHYMYICRWIVKLNCSNLDHIWLPLHRSLNTT